MTQLSNAWRAPTLHTPRLTLRPFEQSDAQDLFELQSDAKVLEFWDSPPWTDRSAIARFMDGNLRREREGTGIRVVIERNSDGAFLGWCTFNSWNPEFRSASLGYCLTERSWGQGYATEAAQSLLAWAFETLDLNRVQAEVDTRNAASARVLQKLGFQLEGTLRQDCTVNLVTSDSWVYGLLRSDWQSRNTMGLGDSKLQAERDEQIPVEVANLLASVPEWFGQPEANEEYIQAAKTKETWSVRDDAGRVIGVTLIDRHFPHAAEIHLMVVERDAQGRGVGTAMIKAIEADARARAVRLLEVKTLGASHPDAGYARTRHFYERCGFLALEETEIWGESTPCLIMVKALK